MCKFLHGVLFRSLILACLSINIQFYELFQDMGSVIRISPPISTVIVSDASDLVLSHVTGGILTTTTLEDEQTITSANSKSSTIRINFYDMVDNGVNILILCEPKYCTLFFFFISYFHVFNLFCRLWLQIVNVFRQGTIWPLMASSMLWMKLCSRWLNHWRISSAAIPNSAILKQVQYNWCWSLVCAVKLLTASLLLTKYM